MINKISAFLFGARKYIGPLVLNIHLTMKYGKSMLKKLKFW